jgi:hypothetical protein
LPARARPATASGPDRATKAADLAVACPLLEGIDLSGARGVLVLLAASKGTFRLSESRNAMNTIRRCAADDAHVSYGTAYDEAMRRRIELWFRIVREQCLARPTGVCAGGSTAPPSRGSRAPRASRRRWKPLPWPCREAIDMRPFAPSGGASSA